MQRPHRRAKAVSVLLAPLLLAGCPGGDDPIVDDERRGDVACEGLDESQCLFPFPSDYFRHVDGDSASLTFGDYVIPSASDERVDAAEFRRSGGWSVITPLYFVLEGATLDGAPPFESIDDSLSPSSRTLIVEADTGALMPHWAELDHFAEREGVAVIALRLARRLREDTRYIVAVRGLVDEDGREVAATPAFRSLRDRSPSRVRGVGARRDRFEEEIFPVLEGIGVDRSELQLAWDFTTDREENVSGTLLAMRDLLLEEIGEDGPEYEIEEVDVDESDPVAVTLRGVAKVPSFLDGTEGEIRRIRRDSSDAPYFEGYEDVPFTVQIPRSVWSGEKEGRLMQYGHGLLGSLRQAHGSWLRAQADEYGLVIIAANMQGMDETDLSLWMHVLTQDLGLLPLLSEKPHQGLVNHIALARMMRGRFAGDDDPRYTFDGAPVYDPEHVYYYGISQGGTLGAVMMSIQTEISRGVLGVPGGAFAFLLSRSTAFEDMADPMLLLYPDPLDFISILGLAQVGFDRVDPINYAHRMTNDTFPGTPPHRVLLQVGKEDGQVNIQVTDILSRTVGASLLAPSVRPVWGLEEVSSPHAGNTAVEFCFGRPDNPRSNYPVDLGGLPDPHSLLRRVPEAQEQIDHFFRTGEVKDVCGGPCYIEGM